MADDELSSGSDDEEGGGMWGGRDAAVSLRVSGPLRGVFERAAEHLCSLAPSKVDVEVRPPARPLRARLCARVRA